ncbi:transporter substrate-binding domain-containing protein [Cellvibrio sp. pealriver]|uniref:transporter substrate-binding domain-containing protein n=1 Tax=Cellvibrio sp. pealriver TaxID=1622269 RepID=UPI000AF093E4|nr:transporter substrate-binding domain-containing protein [Cellvibrio sp. pealriver]
MAHYLLAGLRRIYPGRICTFTVIACLFGLSLPAQAKPVRTVQGNNSIEIYAKGLLQLALSKVPGKYAVQETIPNTSEERMVSMLIDNQLDVVWYATTNDLEERLQPIRICIYRGLLGYRVLMIKKGTQHKFDGIQNLEDLKRVSLGQGRFWADTNVLTANNLNVVKVLKYEGLFYMLDGDRFDAFPRGAHEPWAEMQRHPKLALDVEQNLLLSYTNPFYFFVNKSNTQLAADIERGLRIAIEDGSFNDYFFNDPTVKDAIEKTNLKSRTLIQLQNPGLPPKTPVDDKSLWFDPYALNE